MNTRLTTQVFLACLAVTHSASADNLLAPGDFIIAVDSDISFPASNYPTGEEPFRALDGSSGSKYLNFGGSGTGFIVTPSGPSVVQSFVLTTANDAAGRDPGSFMLWGTNSPILSGDNSEGLGEAWTLIASGLVTLPTDRQTIGSPISFANATSYASYKMTFPTVRNANLMQIGDVQFYSSSNAAGDTILAPSNPILAIDTPAGQSAYPDQESPSTLLDGNTSSKFLNFGRENAGFIVTPQSGASILSGFTITTANDFAERDPSSYEIWGRNGAITTPNNGTGNEDVWTLISSGTLDLPLDRFTQSAPITFENSAVYESYKLVFPENRGPDGGAVNSIQISEVQFIGVPEPGSAYLMLAGIAGVVARRRRS